MCDARLSGCLLLFLSFLNSPAFAQEAGNANTDLVNDIRSLEASLKQTRADLQEYRSEIVKLQGEVESLRTELHDQAQSDSKSAAPGSESATQAMDVIKDDVRMLKSKVDDQYQTKVESASKYRVKLGGILLANFSSTSGSVDDIDVPNLAGAPYNYAQGSFSGTIRQSEINLSVSGPSLLGARTSGLMVVDFFGGIAKTSNGSDFGIGRLKLGHARLDWAHTSLEIGQSDPLISPVSPTSFASLGIPALGYSGNLWAWTPQVAVEHRWNSEKWEYTIQGGLMDPLSGEYPGYGYDRLPQYGEQSRHPAFEARNALTRLVAGRKMTVGYGGYYERQAYHYGRDINGWAATLDWSLPISQWFEVSGEAYRGRAIGGLWGASGVSVVDSGPITQPVTQIEGLNTVGGWTQLKFHFNPKIELNGAIGQDNPFAGGLRTFGTPTAYQYVARNQTTLVNIVDHPRSNLILALEYRHLRTSWTTAQPDSADHVNASVGVIF